MTPASSQLVFNPTPFAFGVGVAFVVAMGGLAFMAWRRSGWRASTGWLELLRFIISVAIAITLLQPEWLETFKPETRPTLAILHDVSGSMSTKDVIDKTKPNAEPLSREAAAQPLISPQLWEPLKQRMDVVIEPFSSSQTPPTEGTDIQAALANALEKQPNLKAVVLISDGDWNTGAAPLPGHYPPAHARGPRLCRAHRCRDAPSGRRALQLRCPRLCRRGQAPAHPLHHRKLPPAR